MYSVKKKENFAVCCFACGIYGGGCCTVSREKVVGKYIYLAFLWLFFLPGKIKKKLCGRK
jgi:hypothetical protein